ncbi:MAG: hypothetical protein O7I42_22375 [Alphaproteobacteria bacterium]|nr:hypothetical protein [Alphaproteobacteria bacterium]
MKIVQRRGDEGGVEMDLSVVQEDGRIFVYFKKSGTDKANLNEAHFVIKPSIAYGDVGTWVFDFKTIVEEFICPDFADRAELEQLRAESAKWRGKVVDPTELEQLRADSAELERLREKQREASHHRARLNELESQLD